MGYDRNTALRELAVMYNVSGDRQVNPQTYSRPTPKPEQAEPKRAAGDLELPEVQREAAGGAEIGGQYATVGIEGQAGHRGGD